MRKKQIAKEISAKGHTQPSQPGLQHKMQPKPLSVKKAYQGANKLKGKVVVITGGDSGIGRAVAILFAKEGADVVIIYLNEHKDAKKTKTKVEKEGGRCIALAGDVGDEQFCQQAITQTQQAFGRIDILINNAAEQHPQESILAISSDQLKQTFQTNVFSYFYMIQAALPLMKKGSVIINTTSVTAYRGSPHLIDYSATKGAIVGLTRALSLSLAQEEIRVNAVAPGPVWTPLIEATFSEEHIKKFGKNVPMQRPGQPEEIAPCYVFLASDDASYISGQVIHPNGGEVING